MSRARGTDPRKDARDEIDFHLDMRVRELMAEGTDPEEARRIALAAFGDPRKIEWDVSRVDDRLRRRRSVRETVYSLTHDIRYAARFLKRNPAFTAVVVATLALGIGATTTIFSLVDAALLRRPPVDDPQSLVAVYTTCRAGDPRCTSSYPDYLDYRERAAGLADLAGTTLQQASLGDEGRGARLVALEAVTGNYFALLGLDADLGRVIMPDDDRLRDGSPVALLSHALWREHFGSDPTVLGTSIRLNGVPFEVVGVAPEDFRGLALDAAPDLWVPLQASAALGTGAVARPAIWEDRTSRWIGRLVGRTQPGTTVDQVREELLAISERLREEDPDARGPRTVTVDPLAGYLLPSGSEEALPQFAWILLGVVGASLLLACANLANLLLARASTRSVEMGIRVAIGAGRSRLLRQMMAESLFLSALGTAAGLALGPLLMRAVGAFELPGGVPIASLGAEVDLRVVLLAAVLCVATAVLFGLAPALHATGGNVSEGLRSGRGTADRLGSAAMRRALVGVQVALCAVLLVGSGLFVRSLRSALAIDPGFRTEDLGVLRFDLGSLRYTNAEIHDFATELRTRALADRRVSAAATGTLVPFQGAGFMGFFTEVQGYQPAADEEMRIDVVAVSAGYVETLGIPLVAGREFEDTDSEGAPPVAIVSRSMAERYWPSGSAVGGLLKLRDEWAQVVGVAEDVMWSALRGETTNFVFLPHAQFHELVSGPLTLAVRTRGDAIDAVSGIRAQGRSMEPDFSPQLLTTMEALVGDVLMPQRLGSALLSAFSALALLLASIGIAGVVSYGVRQQRKAIGVRLALGAPRAQVLRLVATGMALPIAIGLATGLGLASLLDDGMERFLYGVTPGDPLTYVAIVVGLLTVAALAVLIPAREATRVDPLEALRSD